MKFLIVAAAIAALAVASPTKRALVQPSPGGPTPIIDLDHVSPIDIGPALIDGFEPIAIGPAIIDNFEPISIGPAIVNPAPAAPAASAPLVQIILNIDSAVAGSPVAVDTIPSPAPTPVQVVEEAQVPEPVIIVDKPIIPEPVIVVENPIVPEPVIVVENPIVPEPVIVAQPIITAPAINIPDILN